MVHTKGKGHVRALNGEINMIEIDDLKWVGEFVLRERGIKNMGRNDLARKSGCSYQTIQNIETGVTRSPTPGQAFRLLQALGGKIYFSFGDE